MPATVEQKLPEWLKIMLYGDPGSGKTYFLSTVPMPLFVFSFDPHGMQTLAGVPGIEYENYFVDDLKADALQTVAKVKAKLRTIKKENKFATVSMDSLTFLSRLLKGGIITVTSRWGKEPEMREQDWGTLGTQSEEIISLLMGLDCNVILTSHSAVKILELPNEKKDVLYLSALDGIKFPQRLPGYFDEVYRMVVKQKGQTAESNEYLVQTRSDYQWGAKTRLNVWNPEKRKLEPIFKMYEEADFTAMFDKVKMKKAEMEKKVV